MENVYLFVPNVIGYVRLIMCIAACFAMDAYPVQAVLLYSASCLLDALDGYAARKLDQSSRYGAVLDMVLDRATTLTLLVRIAAQTVAAAPWAVVVAQGLAALDLMSHYAHMYASLVTGAESHKQMDARRAPWLLRMYYESKVVLFVVCLVDQLFYIGVYMLTWRDRVDGSEFFEADGTLRMVALILTGISAIVCIFKQVLNVIQLVGAARDLAAFDVKSRAKGKRRKMQ